MDQAEVIAAAINTVTHRLTTEIVGNSNDYNGGRLSGDRANSLAHMAVCELLTNGYALVRLPDSCPGGILRWPVHGRDADAAVTIRHDGKIASDGVSNPYLHPDHARSHAAALLAAADEVFGASFT